MPRRLAIPAGLTRDHVLAAIARIDVDGIDPHSESTHYDVVHNGQAYPPIALLAFAIEILTDEAVKPGHLAGGEGEASFSELDRLGFKPIPKLSPDECLDIYAVIQRSEQIIAKGCAPITPPPGNAQPNRVLVYRENIIRCAQVRAHVLLMAQGVCQTCKNPGPFISRTTGQPYLEVHHIIPLADCGPDTIDNCIALCPNCHRKYHFGIA